MASTRLGKAEIKRLVGACFGCAHAAFEGPGKDTVCKLCARNRGTESGAMEPDDMGRPAYGLRDCYIALDRFEMELKCETFIKGMSPRERQRCA